MKTPIENLRMSVRANNCLDSVGIRCVDDLLHKTDHELLAIPNFSESTLQEVKQKLSSLGLKLGQPFYKWSDVVFATKSALTKQPLDTNAPAYLRASGLLDRMAELLDYHQVQERAGAEYTEGITHFVPDLGDELTAFLKWRDNFNVAAAC